MRALLLFALGMLTLSAQGQPFTHSELAWPDSAWPRAGTLSGVGSTNGIDQPPDGGGGCATQYLAEFYHNGNPASNFTYIGVTSLSATWAKDPGVNITRWTWTYPGSSETFVLTNWNGAGAGSFPFAVYPWFSSSQDWFLNGSLIHPSTDPTNSYTFWQANAGAWSGTFTVTAASQPYRITFTATPIGAGSATNFFQYTYTNTSATINFSCSTLPGTNCFWLLSASVEVWVPNSWSPGQFAPGSSVSITASQ